VLTDQETRTIAAESDETGSPIENEIPTYRAISAPAILALACGVVSVCCFAHPLFYAFSILAVGLGISAHRTIRRFPDMLTGQRLASAGIGLGLAFGLSAFTFATVQSIVRSRNAALFSAQYAKVIETGDMGQLLWYHAHPDSRKDKTGADMLKEFDSMPQDRKRMGMTMGPMAALNKLTERIKSSKGQKVRFVKIEGVGDDEGRAAEVQIYALALFEIEGPASKSFPDEKQSALAVLKARPKGRQFEWWADSVIFPYTPSTYVKPDAPVDDGHGHDEADGH
jgi:hypothetical protein